MSRQFDTLDDYIAQAFEQAGRFNHREQHIQQDIKQAMLLYLTQHKMQHCYIKQISRLKVVFSLEDCMLEEGYIPGLLLEDLSDNGFVITEGKEIYKFATTYARKEGKDIVALGTTRRSEKKPAHDGRHSTTLYFGEYATGNKSGYVQFNDYLIMNLMANEDQREFLFDAFTDPETDSTKYVVNHKDNDSNNCCEDNLEFCTQKENQMHGYFIQLIAELPQYRWLFKTDYYVPKSETSDKGTWKKRLIIGVSAFDVKDILSCDVEDIIRESGLTDEEITRRKEIVAESDANMQLLTEACDA